MTKKNEPVSIRYWGVWSLVGFRWEYYYPVRNTRSHKPHRICLKDVSGVKKNPMNLCVYESEEREDGVGAGVNDTMLSERIGILSLTESVVRTFRFRKQTMNLWKWDSGVWVWGGTCVNATMMSEFPETLVKTHRIIVVYYESMKRKLKIKPIYEWKTTN